MGKGRQTTTTKQELSEEQRRLLDLVFPAAEDISNNTPTQFPGSAVAGFNPTQVAGQNSFLDAAGSTQDFVNSIFGAHTNLQNTAIPGGTSSLQTLAGGADRARGAQDFILSRDVLSPESNPYLQQTADAAVNTLSRQFSEQVLPQISTGAQSAGQVGSSRQGIAEGLAAQGLARESGNVASDIFSRGYGQGLDSLTSTLSDTLGVAGRSASTLLEQGTRSLFAAPELSQLALLPGQIQSAVGGQQQRQEQAFLTEESQRWMQEQLMPFLIAQDVANLAFGVPNGSTTSTATGGGGGGLGSLIGGLGSLFSGLGAFGALF